MGRASDVVVSATRPNWTTKYAAVAGSGASKITRASGFPRRPMNSWIMMLFGIFGCLNILVASSSWPGITFSCVTKSTVPPPRAWRAAYLSVGSLDEAARLALEHLVAGVLEDAAAGAAVDLAVEVRGKRLLAVLQVRRVEDRVLPLDDDGPEDAVGEPLPRVALHGHAEEDDQEVDGEGRHALSPVDVEHLAVTEEVESRDHGVHPRQTIVRHL